MSQHFSSLPRLEKKKGGIGRNKKNNLLRVLFLDCMQIFLLCISSACDESATLTGTRQDANNLC